MKAIVFDLGGTLMEYVNMPYVWFDYYESAFEEVNRRLGLGLSESNLRQSVDILKSYNPGINYREIDYSPEKIFEDAVKGWRTDVPLERIITEFFGAMHLEAAIYPESIETLSELKRRGLIIGTYTNVVSGMPDELHKSYFKELLPYFDIYVSSSNCGFRKPHPRGLEIIAQKYGLRHCDMLFVGDEQKDVETAKRFGCRSVLINRSSEKREFGQDITVSNLTELMDSALL